MRALVSHLQVVAAILIAMLALGKGLPGIVSAIHDAPSHVCTCAAGADHASCPICNPQLEPRRPSKHPTASGRPCGMGRLASIAASEVGTLPGASLLVPRPLERLDAPTARPSLIREVCLEPLTPPPRSLST